MYPALVIANFFIELSLNKGKPISPMKLMKLVYFAHGWYLAVFKKPLIFEEVEAWEYGPVISKIYHEFKKYGTNPITEKCEIEEEVDEIDNETKLFLKEIHDAYHHLNAVQLANMTHQEGTPWEIIYKEYHQKIPYNKIIPEKSIAGYFETELTAP